VSFDDDVTSDQGPVAVGHGGDGMAEARPASSGSLFMLFTLSVPLRCEILSGLLKPSLRVSSCDRDGPAYSSSRLLFWYGSM
jgi:hypothetical protein